MTARKPKPLGTSIEVPQGTRVRRPGSTEEVVVVGGVYVLDVPGVHIIDGHEQPVGDDDTPTPES